MRASRRVPGADSRPATMSRIALLAAAGASLICSTSTAAQERRESPFADVRHEVRLVAPLPTVFAGPTSPAPRLGREGAAPAAPSPHPEGPASPGRIIGGALLGTIGSYYFVHMGAVTGWLVGGYDSGPGPVYTGAALGSVLGATFGAAMAVGHVGKSAVGSVAGGLAGLLLAVGVDGITDHESPLPALTFALVQGTAAAVTGGR